MSRTIVVLTALLSVVTTPVYAQDLSSGLRGSVSDASADAQAAKSAGQTQVTTQRNAYSNVYALRVVGSQTSASSTGLGTDGRNVPVQPFADRVESVQRSQTGTARSEDDSVFDGDTRFDQAEGFRVGTFTVTPEISVLGGYSDNISQTAGGEAGQYLRLLPSVNVTSDWVRHELNMNLRGSYTTYSTDEDDDVTASGDMGLRLDIGDGTAVNIGAGYAFSQEDSSSAEAAGGADDIHNLSGTISVSRAVGLVGVNLGGGIDRSIYEQDGGTSDTQRDNTLYSANLRLSAETGAVLTPFADAALLLRRYDDKCSDGSCVDRNSKGYQLRLGTRIDSGSKLAGEVAAGWRVEDLDDKSLGDLSGFVLDGSLIWSPTRLTTVTTGMGTRFETSDITGAAGSLIYSGDVRIAHDFGDRIAGEIGGGYSLRQYEGVDIEEKTLSGLAGVTVALTRNAAFRAQYIYRSFDTSENGGDYQENAIEAGIRIRH